MELLHGQDLHQSDLAGMGHMGSAAGADIRAGESHDPHLAGKLFLAAIRNLPQLLRGRIPALYRAVQPYFFVDLLLHVSELLLGQLAGEVDGHHIRAHVEAHIVVAIDPMHHAGHHMLTGVLLSQIKAPIPVDDRFNLGAHLNGLLRIMEHQAVLFVGIHYLNAVEGAVISGLSAALGIKAGFVQYNLIAVLSLPALQHLRRGFAEIGVLIK